MAHPDDAEVMLGHAIAVSRDPLVVVATDGTASTVDMLGEGFVQAGRRRTESQSGLRHLGVLPQRQVYLGLPDGSLHEHKDALNIALAGVGADFQPDRWFTTGIDGYDGHTDHMAAHDAAHWVRMELGSHSVLWALDSDHSGEHRVARQPQKLGAIAMHASQRVNPDLAYWGDTDVYTSLIIGDETYTALTAESVG